MRNQMAGPIAALAAVCALALALLALSPMAASAGTRSAPLAFVPGGQDGGRAISQPVDWLTWCGDCVSTNFTSTAPWVTNPTTCMWDTDDSFEYMSAGSALAARASTGITACSYESTSGLDPNLLARSVVHAAYLDITAPSPNLRISETFSWQGGSHTFVPTVAWNASSKRYEYRACMVINGVANGTWSLVPGSNGGWGVPVSIEASVANPTSRAIPTIGGTIQYGWLEFYAGGCQVPSPLPAPLQ